MSMDGSAVHLLFTRLMKASKNTNKLKAIFTPSTGSTHIDKDYLKKN